MTMKKKMAVVFLLTFLVTLLAFSVCFADLIDIDLGKPIKKGELVLNKTISKVEVEIPTLVDGEKQIEKENITITEGTYISNMSWTNVSSNVFMTTNETYKNNKKYSIRIYIKPSDGYTISDDVEVTVNGKKVAVTKMSDDSGRFLFDREFTVGAKETQEETTPKANEKISKVEFTIPEIKAGSLQLGEKDITISKGAKFDGFTWVNDASHTFMLDDEKYEEGKSYTLRMFFDAEEGYDFENLRVTVNGKEVEIVKVSDPNDYKFEKTFEVKAKEEETETKPLDESFINHFAFKITAPKIGEKPATTAKALKDGYKVTEVVWKTSDKKFVEGETYTVQIYFELSEEDMKRVRSDYFATVNDIDAEIPNGDEKIFKNEAYAEYTFPTLRDTSKKATWTEASKWATDELNKAADKDLIPDSLDKQDLTKEITRKEFAHIAVRLYEVIARRGIEVTFAPFKDTDDVEVAKAYKVGITQGTSANEFSPDKKITREEMATMMARTLEKAYVDTFIDTNKVDKFADDNLMHDWSREAIYFMAKSEIIKGMGNNLFGVTDTATRQQALLISVRSVEQFAK